MPTAYRRILRDAGLVVVVASTLGCTDNVTLPPEKAPATAGEVEPLDCIPNLDGQISSDEISAAIGVPIRYVVSPPGTERSVDLVGQPVEDGTTDWQFATDYADDQSLTITPIQVVDQWYANSFPEGAFVAPFDAAGQIEQIALTDGQSLLLLGLASSEADPPEGRTLLVYDPPVTLLTFPVSPGMKFVSVGNVANATLLGLPYAGRDTYEVEADGLGHIDLPSLSFTQVHRVRTRVTLEPAVGASTSEWRTSFYAECFAEVVRATSRADETEENFSTAAELRRLGF